MQHYILTSTQGNRTFMMTSHDLHSFIVFDNPKSEVDKHGNTLVYFSTIHIRRI
ncbi:hypothetical protein FDG95_gp584 [Pectobacterium phage vB_PcaM_CBB]|uniref:Uncharacterized protein n=1 Tax=Pectobacterium phage vB_PcaM_CBB TaxID=2772511 RepID=A0A1L2CVB4_9CAUD|nr:hypothetical protein FDG95_gp584 [Pectobacterium phage vB_PcaM_CBB]AMM43958.1 hypothetical protein CBB_395 [Pectobacterium phage vB_PcaM_CBB]